MQINYSNEHIPILGIFSNSIIKFMQKEGCHTNVAYSFFPGRGLAWQIPLSNQTEALFQLLLPVVSLVG